MQGDFSVFSDDWYRFATRHIGPSEDDQRAMLATLGYASLDELLAAALPAYARPPASLAALPSPRTEQEALADLRRLAARNTVRVSMIGLGYYDTITPAVIRRNVLEDPAWYTAYTPYQPEISQGRLEALLNFQTIVCDLTGLGVANASLLDEASAAAEAMTLCFRGGSGKRAVFLADADCLPQTLDVLRTRAEPLGIDLRVAPVTADTDFTDTFGVLLQYPGASGEVRDLTPVIEAAHAAGARVAVAADLLALTLLKPPGELGADIALGTTQRFGVPMFYGGPHAAYLAVRDDLKRQLPGRLVGVSVDADGRPPTGSRCKPASSTSAGRRPRATSAPPRCCSPSRRHVRVLPRARRADGHRAARAPARGDPRGDPEGTTASRRAPPPPSTPSPSSWGAGRGPGRVAPRRRRRVQPVRRGPTAASCRSPATRRPPPSTCGTSSPRWPAPVVRWKYRGWKSVVGSTVVGSTGGLDPAEVRLTQPDGDAIPAHLARTSKFLTHPVFSAHHSETAMLRYLRRLSDADVALTGR